MIEGVPTSTAALLGETVRGPVEPRLVTSLAEFQRYFGSGLRRESYLADAVQGFFLNGGTRLIVCRIVSVDAKSAIHGTLPIEANCPGGWGNRVFIQISPNGANRRFNLKIAYFDAAPAGFPIDPFADPAILASAEVVEQFIDLQSAEPGIADHWRKALEDSELVLAASDELVEPPGNVEVRQLAGGSDGRAVIPADYLGVTVEDQQTGLLALDSEDYNEISLLAAPGLSDPDVVGSICSHCDDRRYRFAVLDGPKDPADITGLDPRAQWNTSRAAYYVPWLRVPDDEGGSRPVPPSGHVLGVYARTDTERGIWTAPANEDVRGISGLSVAITVAQQDILNPRGVNVIRRFEGRGILLWGARTLSTQPEFKYIPVRRFLSWVEHSIELSLQWVVFEPNAEPLWTRVTGDVSDFLHHQWRQGALMGVKPEHAFFVRCDRSTMTQDDILNGRLICEVGLAVVRPAEFIVFRIYQLTAEAAR